MRRWFGTVVAGFALFSLAAQPILAAQPDAGLGATDTVTGTLEVAHSDDFAHATQQQLYWLRNATGRIGLHFQGRGPEVAGGARVRVSGHRSGASMTVIPDAAGNGAAVLEPAAAGPADARVAADGFGAPASSPSMAAATSAAPVAKSVAVLLVNFANDASQPVAPATATSVMFSNANSVKNFFEEESRGALTVSGHVFGWYTIAATNANCDWSTWGAQARSAAAAAGVNLAAYTNVVYAWPRASSCGWAGLGYMPGAWTFNNGSFNLRVLAHELSHNLGVAHASSLSCTDAGAVVAISATCTYSEYGDPFTIMGSGSSYHNDGQQVGELGWLTAGEVQTVAPGGTYHLEPLLGSPAGTVKVLRVARGDGTWFYLDVRSTYGATFDTFAAGSPAVTGVTIRLSPDGDSPTGSPKNTKLIDANPSTATFADAPLGVGQTLLDPVSQIKITTVSVDASGAVVQVQEVVAPSAPGALTATAMDSADVDLAWTAATDNVAVTGYRIVRDGILVTALAADARAYHDTGLTALTSYAYQVQAEDGSGNVGTAIGASVTTPDTSGAPPPRPPAPDMRAPSAPRSVHAGTYSAKLTRLTWLAATDNVRVVGYRVYRVGRSAPVTTTAGRSVKVHRVRGAVYYVRAYDARGNVSSRSVRVRAL